MAKNTVTALRNGIVVLLIAVFFVAVGVVLMDAIQPEIASQRGRALEEEGAAQPSWQPSQPPGTEEPATGEASDVASSPFVAVAERLKPSVVNIIVEKSHPDGLERFLPDDSFHGGDFNWTTGGSGVIVDSRGHVLTNNHVIRRAEEIQVRFADGTERSAELVGSDPETDLALLDVGSLPEAWVATLGDSDGIHIGDWALALGNPLGLDWTLTVGVISAKGRSDLLIEGGGPIFQDFIQTDASINFGNSGGPLANVRGEVIGINTATDAEAHGIGFAIPINMARDVLGELLEKGYVRRGYLGMVPGELDELKREALYLPPDTQGIFVESVAPGTPAEAGGLRGGDVILALDGEPVKDVQDFRLRIAEHEPGARLELRLLRKGEERSLEFVLADRSEYVQAAREGVRSRSDSWLGITVSELPGPGSEREAIEVATGVLVTRIAPESPAWSRLQPGDVIGKLQDSPVEDLQQWQELTEEMGTPKRAVLMTVYVQGRKPARIIAVKP